jgi:ABC-type glutathione transport system ATPase component
MLRLAIHRGEEMAIVIIPFAALQVLAAGLKSDDEASMRAAFIGHAFALNAKLSNRVSVLGAGEILLVTPAMLRK